MAITHYYSVPSSVLEAYVLTIQAVNFSEKYRTPVILLMDQVIGHMREKVVLPPDESLRSWNAKNLLALLLIISPISNRGTCVLPMAPFGEGTATM